MRKTPRKLRVLVADDNELLREAIVQNLADRFELVGAVSNGRELVEATLLHNPDVVISDASMPLLTGAGALKLLRSSGQRVPFVLLTAEACGARAWCELGMLAVVDKRDLYDELVAAVESAAAGTMYLSRHARER